MRGATAGVQRKRCAPKCPLYPLLCTWAQPDHATGHRSCFPRGDFFFLTRWICQLFFKVTQAYILYVLDKMVPCRLPTCSNIRLNFHSRAINTVFEHREHLIHCFENIWHPGDIDPSTIREAGALAMLLEHQDFRFLLELFHHIIPHVDLLYAKLQKKNIDSVYIKGASSSFNKTYKRSGNTYSC